MSTKKKTNDQVLDAEVVDAKEVEVVDDNNFDSTPDFSPFDEPVKERDYTKSKVDASELNYELEEPVFEAPSFSDFEEDEETTKEPFNKSYNELGNKEKKMGADMIADVVIDGYSRLKKGMGSLASISEAKLEREFAEGNINPNIELPIDEYGNTASIRDFVKEFNETSKDAFDTSNEFKEKVKEPLVRVFQKRGVGMTDEQLLLYYFGTDFATSGITAFGLKKSADGILKQLREQTTIMTTPVYSSQPQPKSEPKPQASTDVSESETVFEEPEEVYEVQADTTAPKSKSNSNFVSEAIKPDGMPEFGDTSILKEIDKIASKESTSKPKGKRGRPRNKK